MQGTVNLCILLRKNQLIQPLNRFWNAPLIAFFWIVWDFGQRDDLVWVHCLDHVNVKLVVDGLVAHVSEDFYFLMVWLALDDLLFEVVKRRNWNVHFDALSDELAKGNRQFADILKKVYEVPCWDDEVAEIQALLVGVA